MSVVKRIRWRGVGLEDPWEQSRLEDGVGWCRFFEPAEDNKSVLPYSPRDVVFALCRCLFSMYVPISIWSSISSSLLFVLSLFFSIVSCRKVTHEEQRKILNSSRVRYFGWGNRKWVKLWGRTLDEGWSVGTIKLSTWYVLNTSCESFDCLIQLVIQSLCLISRNSYRFIGYNLDCPSIECFSIDSTSGGTEETREARAPFEKICTPSAIS